MRNLVEVGELTKCSKEVVSGDSSLTFEESKPEYLSVLGAKFITNFLGKIVVHDVLEIDLVEIIGPWVQN